MSKAKILVAEDDPADLDLFQEFLESQGYDVTAASDGNRALHLGASGQFDLVILDIHMPLYDGVEVLHMLRKRFLRRPIRVMAVTADVNSKLHDQMDLESVDSFVTKPIDLTAFGDEVTRLLALH
jgi:two-component system response regulator QseB